MHEARTDVNGLGRAFLVALQLINIADRQYRMA